MKSNTSTLTVSVFVILIFLAFNVLGQNPYTHSESITCGNNLCEASSLELNIGEEKSKFIGKQSYAFKLVNIEKIENPYLSYNFYLSINNGPSMLADEAKKQYNINFNCCALIGIQEGQGQSNPTGAQINFDENEVCAIPYCAFPVELNVYKKWNLVPLYFMQRDTRGSSYDIESALGKGTCKLQDFTAIYGYDSINNKYVNLYSWGRSSSDLATSLSNFERIAESNKILVGAPFNSVWIYSNSQCKLAAEVPNPFKNFLLFLAAAGADRTETVSVAYQPGEEPPPPQTRTTEGIKFAPGWNFFVGSPDMDGKSLDEIKGSCNIEKANTFDASSQSWKQLTTGVGISSNFIFKVTNKCMLGMPQVAPPEIPQ